MVTFQLPLRLHCSSPSYKQEESHQMYFQMQTNTRNVWPWSLLVPMLEKEIWKRMPAATEVDLLQCFILRMILRLYRWTSLYGSFSKPLSLQVAKASNSHVLEDPYNNSLTLPLEDFLAHQEVTDVLHNGAALQVGLLSCIY